MLAKNQEREAPDKNCYMGVDIQSSSPLSSNPLYSIVVLCGDKLVYKNDGIPIERIVRLSWDYNVKKIGVDNPFELASTPRDLIKLGELFPENTELVQVNMIDGVLYDMRDLLKKMGVSPGRLTSSRTAYYLALLAKSGFGTRVIEREPRTKIYVRKKRSLGSGGMSSNRFKRKVRTAVLQITNEIKRKLDGEGLDYEVLYRKTSGGLEGSIFTVYASPGVVRKIVRPRRGTSVSVEVKPSYRVSLRLSTSLQEQKALIVGIDPGLNTGIAILDINGTPLYLGTKRQADRSVIIDLIREYGKPVIVATDVAPVPDKVKKMASLFNAMLYVPDKVMSAEEKHALAGRISENYGIRVPDSHSRDALAAAYNAYRRLSSKLEEVDRYIFKTGLTLSASNIKRLILAGKSIAEAIEQEIGRILKDNSTRREVRITEKRRRPVYDNRLVYEIQELKKERQKLAYRIKQMEERVRQLQGELEKERRLSRISDRSPVDEMLSESMKRKVRELSERLRQREKDLESLEKKFVETEKLMEKVSVGRAIVVPRIKTLTKSNLNSLNGRPPYGLLVVDNPSIYQEDVIKELRDKKVKAILVLDDTNTLLQEALSEAEIPVVDARDSLISIVGSTAVFSHKIVDDVDKARSKLSRLVSEKVKERVYREILNYKRERIEKLKRSLNK